MSIQITLLNKGLSYAQFLAHCQEIAQAPTHSQAQTYEKNLGFMTQIYAHFFPTEVQQAQISQQGQQIWMVLAEGWCGDVACILPIIAKLAEVNSQIILRILRRDEHLPIMDNYLTHGGRSIPKLVAFETNGNELWQWGPRPKEAQKLITDLKEKETPFPELVQQLLAWYETDAGKSIAQEITAVSLAV